jgi:hypothetical protein
VALHLRSGVKDVFMEWLRSTHPELVERYGQLYRRGAYAPPGERARVAELIRRDSAGRAGHGRYRFAPPPPAAPAGGDSPSAAPPLGQERLF